MNFNIGVNNFSQSDKVKFQNNMQNNSPKTTAQPSFGAGENHSLTPEQAAALAAQRGVGLKPKVPHITEKDINFSVTCVGYGNVKGNTREVFDYRCSMQRDYGIRWYQNFYNPHIVRNGNLDERRNGETTALVFPLNPDTPGLRGQDNMAMVLSGNVSRDILNELVVYMAKIGVLNDKPIGKMKYYVNSTSPKEFMANPKIKTAIAHFFKQKELQQTEELKKQSETNKPQAAQEVSGVKDDKEDNKVKASDINIANLDCQQDKNNKRKVNDYVRFFLKNDKRFTVLHDSFMEGGQKRDMTVILIPSKKSEWDCLTVTIDNKKMTYYECKNLINHLAKNKMANIENENFRAGVVDYLNSGL